MPLIRFGRYLPTTLREWNRVLENLGILARSGELEVVDPGNGQAVEIGLADCGTAGEYPVVTTDDKGRVISGRALAETDIPAEIARDTEVAAAITTHDELVTAHSAAFDAHRAETDPHPDLIDDLDAASSVALTDKAIISQGGTNKSATLEKVRDLMFGDDWTDLVVPVVAINPLGSATPPTLNNNTGCLEFSDSADNVIILTWQMPHGWSGQYDATKAVVVPHLHVRFLTATSAPTNVSRWKCEYDAADPYGNFTNAYGSWTSMTTVSVTNPNDTTECGLIDLGDIDLAGLGGSAILHAKISRLAGTDGTDTDTSVIALYSADLHYQTRSAGSENEIPS